jgi:hypothetical protein
MTDVPKEIEAVLNDPKLQEAVVHQPGSRRFRAMVLGLSALQYIKEQERTSPETEPEQS